MLDTEPHHTTLLFPSRLNTGQSFPMNGIHPVAAADRHINTKQPPCHFSGPLDIAILSSILPQCSKQNIPNSNVPRKLSTREAKICSYSRMQLPPQAIFPSEHLILPDSFPPKHITHLPSQSFTLSPKCSPKPSPSPSSLWAPPPLPSTTSRKHSRSAPAPGCTSLARERRPSARVCTYLSNLTPPTPPTHAKTPCLPANVPSLTTDQ